ncbi:kinase-like protein [Coccomyxa subellipsoidea C-169]|uniref:Kinase-like protein n=1 Tax=Coccomyxa subellipsoidea (strain C-169) TaxID=574566 RepID=I0Z937_COCSC|nr:kinase-like protein [Coccomyxa subellipsoidea C-169]EIE27156.1 kinase-like protein [Coccomyxa subellipsoidea C-169]|eukprot:XP_005651700.1 kinase-like protein [Coccomyxa subellipsoidea C-169]
MGFFTPMSCALLLAVSACLVVVAPVDAQRSVPVSNTVQFAAALQNAGVSEIILDPTNTGGGGGTLTLEGSAWLEVTYPIQTGRDLTIRSVNGNPTMLDLGNIPAILNIQSGASLELRDLLVKNVARQKDLQDYQRTANDSLTAIYGMLTWPSFYAQPGANLRIYNTTQYFWSYTLFRRGDCNFALTTPAPQQQQVLVNRGQQTYRTVESGYTQLAETGLYRAVYPVYDFDNQTYLGGVNVSSENSLGYCVPTNSSANEVIAGLARASATRDSGHASNHVTAIAAGSAVGAAVLLLILMAVAISVFVRRRRRERLAGSAELASFRSLQSGMSPAQSDSLFRSAGTNEPLETHLLHHGRLRRLGPLDEEQVEVGPLLGRGSFGRVYKGRWRSTLVAIKVVEHASVSNDTITVAEQKIEREALLATSLAHPNIIATFKICRMSAGSALGTNKSGMSTFGGARTSGAAAAQRRASSQDAGPSGAESALGLYGGRVSRDAGSGGSGRGSSRGGSSSSNGGGRRPAGGRGDFPITGIPAGETLSAGNSDNAGARQPPSSIRGPQGSIGMAGSAESFDPSTAVIVDMPGSSPPNTAPGKGSDSAQNNGGKRPQQQGSQEDDLELMPEEKENEDDDDNIEERRSRLLETWCLMEYAEKGSLADALRVGRFNRPNGLPDISTVLSCLTDVASGMEYLHAAGILHGDLKPANVLLKSTSADRRGFICKLCDFGMSRLMDASQATHVSTQTYGTMPYMPPELLAHSQLTPQADVYSFGMVMWELYTGQMPFANFTVGQVFFAVVHDRLRPPLEFFRDAMAKNEMERPILEVYMALLERCWSEAAADRPKFPEILKDLAGMRAQLTQLRLAAGAGPAPGSGSRAAAAIRSPFAAPGSPPATPSVGASPTTAARPPQPPQPQQPPLLAVQLSEPAPAAAGDGLSLLRSPSFEAQQAAKQQAGSPTARPELPVRQEASPPAAPQQ